MRYCVRKAHARRLRLGTRGRVGHEGLAAGPAIGIAHLALRSHRMRREQPSTDHVDAKAIAFKIVARVVAAVRHLGGRFCHTTKYYTCHAALETDSLQASQPVSNTG